MLLQRFNELEQNEKDFVNGTALAFCRSKGSCLMPFVSSNPGTRPGHRTCHTACPVGETHPSASCHKGGPGSGRREGGRRLVSAVTDSATIPVSQQGTDCRAPGGFALVVLVATPTPHLYGFRLQLRTPVTSCMAVCLVYTYCPVYL